MKPEHYQSTIDEIEDTIKSHGGGWADKEALAKAVELVDRIRSNEGSDSYIVDKASQVKSCAAILYSARKHTKYASSDESGVLVMRSRIHSALHALGTWPDTRANMERIQKET